jgi:TPR repeat protein
MKRFKLLLFIAVLAGLAALAHAGSDEGVAAYRRGDYAKAYKEFKPLAEQGNADAQYILGAMYSEGQGVPQDYVEAMRWYRKAAEQGDAHAQYILGAMYDEGEGVPQDYTEALKWYRRAAEQGHAYAQWTLGLVYHEGQSVPQDYVQAHMWFSLAAAQGVSVAEKFRDSLAEKMTPVQLAEAQRLAREWKPKGKE